MVPRSGPIALRFTIAALAICFPHGLLAQAVKGEEIKAEEPKKVQSVEPKLPVPRLVSPEEKKILRPPLILMTDFGALEDGKEKRREDLEKVGWCYLFDSRIPKADHAWSPLSLWRVRNPKEPQRNRWTIVEEEGQRILRNTVEGGGAPGTDLISLQNFWDFDLHVEFRVPENSNSGIYLRGRYEIQILSTPAEKKTEELGPQDLGGIYNVRAPSANASKGPGKWQTIDASIRGFRVTVRLNGQLIQPIVEIPQERRGGTGSELGLDDGVFTAGPDEPGPLFLQGDHGSVDFRNIRIRPAGPPPQVPIIREGTRPGRPSIKVDEKRTIEKKE